MSEWVNAHRREAWLYLLAMVAREKPEGPEHGSEVTIGDADVADELGFSQMVEAWLTSVDDPPQKVARIVGKAVRRVRDFAEGRKVRETFDRWDVSIGKRREQWKNEGAAKARARRYKHAKVIRVHVRRARRAK